MGIIHLEDSNGQEKRQIYLAQTINYVHNFSALFPKSICAFFASFWLISLGFGSILVAKENSVSKRELEVLKNYKPIRMNPIRFYLRASRATEFGLMKQRQKSKVFEDNISTELMSKMPVSHAGDALKRGYRY